MYIYIYVYVCIYIYIFFGGFLKWGVPGYPPNHPFNGIFQYKQKPWGTPICGNPPFIIGLYRIIRKRSYAIGISPTSWVEPRPLRLETDAELTKPAKLRKFTTSDILGLEQPRKKGGLYCYSMIV